MEVSLDINAEKIMSRHQNAGRNGNVKTCLANKSFENEAKLKYFENSSNKLKCHTL